MGGLGQRSGIFHKSLNRYLDLGAAFVCFYLEAEQCKIKDLLRFLLNLWFFSCLNMHMNHGNLFIGIKVQIMIQ